ncbi:MAG TPA: protein serine/threonine phosphatase 2C family protein [Thiothrix sp.]|nr:protein serine/threonine phosphatase 2C family protein [Thiothrix sp.]
MSNQSMLIPPIQWHISAHSHCGMRDENQDNYLIIDAQGQCEYLRDEQKQMAMVDHWPKGHVRIAVIDGMGGHEHGREFAEDVVLELMKIPFQTNAEALKTALTTLHDTLFERYYRGGRSPGSTLVMADVTTEGVALLANIGDSRAFLCRGECKGENEQQLTFDHTEAGIALRDGFISETDYQAVMNKYDSRIAQALGYGCIHFSLKQHANVPSKEHRKALSLRLEQPYADIFTLKLSSNSMLMLASDGKWDRHNSDNTTIVRLSNVPF